jgi:hypothetical protein
MTRKPLVNASAKEDISNRIRLEMEVPNTFVRLRITPPLPYKEDSLSLLEMSLEKISKLIKSKHAKGNT